MKTYQSVIYIFVLVLAFLTNRGAFADSTCMACNGSADRVGLKKQVEILNSPLKGFEPHLFCNKPYDSICSDYSYNGQVKKKLNTAKQKAVEKLIQKRQLQRSEMNQALAGAGSLDDSPRLQYLNHLLDGLDNTQELRSFYTLVKDLLMERIERQMGVKESTLREMRKEVQEVTVLSAKEYANSCNAVGNVYYFCGNDALLPGGFVANCNGQKAVVVCPALYILNSSKNNFRGMAMVLAHEMSHYIDNAESNGVDRTFPDAYKKLIACSHDTSAENIADYWAIETMGIMLYQFQNPDEIFSFLKDSMHGLCETPGGMHASGYQRIGDFLRNNPTIKRVMKCGPMSLPWEFWREAVFEEKAVCTPTGSEL